MYPQAPVLRKDFIISEYQIWESFHGGADAILLIADAIDVSSYRSYISNKSILDKRDKFDYPYIQSISEDPTQPVPDHQPPGIYQLDLLVYPLKDSSIPSSRY